MRIRKSEVYKIIEWIQDWFEENGKGCKAVIGISGGKDSTVAAKLCVEALGKDRVLGVLMPNGEQSDIDIAREVIEYLGIQSYEINIKDGVNAIASGVFNAMDNRLLTEQMTTNLPARIRMCTLYAVAQNLTCGGRVINTCNFSEDYVGYSTKYGDAAGDCAPLPDFTATEIPQIGDLLNIPQRFTRRPPKDGLCGKTDEENLGFTYEQLDRYVTTGSLEQHEAAVQAKIQELHKRSVFKLRPIAAYKREKPPRAFGFASAGDGQWVDNCWTKE